MCTVHFITTKLDGYGRAVRVSKTQLQKKYPQDTSLIPGFLRLLCCFPRDSIHFQLSLGTPSKVLESYRLFILWAAVPGEEGSALAQFADSAQARLSSPSSWSLLHWSLPGCSPQRHRTVPAYLSSVSLAFPRQPPPYFSFFQDLPPCPGPGYRSCLRAPWFLIQEFASCFLEILKASSVSHNLLEALESRHIICISVFKLLLLLDA